MRHRLGECRNLRARGLSLWMLDGPRAKRRLAANRYVKNSDGLPLPKTRDSAAHSLDIVAPGSLVRMSISAVLAHDGITVHSEVSQADGALRQGDINKSVNPAKPSRPKPTHLDECNEQYFTETLPESRPTLSVPFTMNRPEADPPP